MYRNSPTINFIASVARKISDKLIRDFQELENLQPIRINADKFAFASLTKIKQMFIDEITKVYPDDSILINGEKEYIPERASSRRWVINPISGFDNFARSIPYFCITATLQTKMKEKDYETIASFIEVPMLNEVYYAEKNSGAFTVNRRMRTSDVNQLLKAVVCGNYTKGFNAINLRLNSCRPLDLAFIASGKYDACIAQNKTFDDDAGLFILKESGGSVTNLDGKTYTAENGFVASNGKVHQAVIKAIS